MTRCECGRVAVVRRAVRGKSSRSARAGRPVCVKHHDLCPRCFERETDRGRVPPNPGGDMEPNDPFTPKPDPTPPHVARARTLLTRAAADLARRAKGYDAPAPEAPDRARGMDLFDAVEALAGWHAAGEDLGRAIAAGRQRLGYGAEFERLLRNTAKKLGWLE